MSREVRRVPLDWQHPMVWAERWDSDRQCVRKKLVPRALLDGFPGAVAEWERDGRELANREGFDWRFGVEYYLTGYKGLADDEATVHPFYVTEDESVAVRDEDHLAELLVAKHATERPDPLDYMPDFSDRDPASLGWCMYETCSEGTPISPVLGSPEELARWLADNGASAFGYSTATYEQWLNTCRAGWAPSMIATAATGLVSGVAASALMDGGES